MTTDGMTVRARYAILAHAPVLYSRIQFVPALPRRQHQLHQHISMGFVIKVHAVYDRPFWREQGLSGTAFSPYELSHEAYDNTNHGDERGTLVGFVSDQNADDVFTLSRPRSARSASSSRSRTTTVPRRRTRSSTTRATGAPRSGPAAPTPRASTSAD